MKRAVFASTILLSIAVLAQNVEKEDSHFDNSPSYEDQLDSIDPMENEGGHDSVEQDSHVDDSSSSNPYFEDGNEY